MKRLNLSPCHITTSLVCLALLCSVNAALADNTGSGGTIVYTDTNGLNPVASPPYIGGYVVHKFTAGGTLTIPSSTNADVLVVAGGGGGGGRWGGGGGAGGLIYTNLTLGAGTYGASVGGGGYGTAGNNQGNNGDNSVLGSLTALGGGGGGIGYLGPVAPQSGGSGGGGGGTAPYQPGGTGLQPGSASGGFGNNGGSGLDAQSYGGGGGAGAVGGTTNGGAGLQYAISGVNTYYAGGGGGAVGGTGGQGGGGAVGANGAANTGGGGGGGLNSSGGNGGSGIVIVRYSYITNPPVSVAISTPTVGQQFLNGSPISATALVAGGTQPYSVTYYYKLTTAGSYSTTAAVGPFGSTNSFTQTLGALPPGDYQVYATVVDSLSGTASSVTNTFGVYSTGNAGSPNAPSELKVNNLVNPLGIDTSNPRFSWIVNDTDRGESQTAYQIVVASSLANINNNSGDKWDSGKVMSGLQGDVIYSGSALASRSNYWARVRTWDKDGNISPWSPAAMFETAFLNPSTEWPAKMIGGDYWRYRKQFTLASKTIARARAYISGKDEFVLRINGSKIGNSVVNSDAAYYDLRKWYFTDDVTGNLTSGTSNTVAVFVGAGRFGFENRWGTYADRGFTLQLEVTYTDGTRDVINSDGTWKCTKTGPFINDQLNNLYDGEKYDARNEDAWDSNGFDDSSWSAAIEVTNTATMTARYMEPMLVTQTITPVSVTQTPSGTYVFDMGQNISGYAQLTVNGPAGTTNIIKFGELLAPDGTVDQSNLKVWGGAQATDWYVCKGGGTEVWEPMFTLHGYQYVELSGFPGTPTVNSLKGRVVHHAVDIDDSTKGSFSCSDALLNKIHSCFIWGIRNNMSAGMPTDCCQRDERMGWLGDAMLETEGVSYNYQVENFFSQWMNSVDDCQSPGGYIDSAGPNQGLFADNLASGGDVPWTSASVIIPYRWYMAYGNTSSLQQIFGKMKRYLDWLQATQNPDHTQSRDQWGDHGDWRTDHGLLATAFYFKAADTLSKIATQLGNTADASTYATLAGTIKNAFNAKYLIGNSYYTGNYPTANAIPLAFNLVPDSARTNVLSSLVSQLRTDGFTMHAGILGTLCMFEALCENGRSDIAYLLATQNVGQSWGNWIMNMNATTMFEFWDGSKSHDHAYYGGPIDSYFYKYLAGISPATAGYKTIKIKPTISANLTNVNATVNTYRGPVSCSWSTSGKTISMNVTIPVNSQAEVYVPACGCGTSKIFITEGGTKIWSSGAYIGGVAGISFNRTDGDYVVFNVGSGNYSFLMTADGSVSSPGGPAGYTWCSADGGTYNLSGTCDVAYGANGLFHYLQSQTGPVTFNSATFGDPIVGTVKAGYFKNSDPSGPAGYTWCAYETGSFTLSGACDVAFGANGAYNYLYNQTGTIKFDVNTFGDPIVGVSKLGFFKVSTIILSTTNQTGSGIGTFIPNWGAVTNGSLIAGQLPSSATGDFNLEPYFGTRSVNSLTAGGNLAISGGGSPATTSANYVTCGNGGSPAAGSSVIYTLAGSANGYDLTNIVVYGGWGDSGRDQQAYTVYYSTVAAPAIFIPLMPVNFNPSIAAGLQSATRVSLTYPGGVLAANVAAVKFDFTSPGSENGYCGYSQITVFGIPSTNAISIPIITTTNQTGSGSGPFYPGWTVVTNGSLIAGHAPDSASGNFTEEVSGRNVNSLTAGGNLGITLIQGTLAGTCSTNYVTCGNGGGAGSSVTYVLTGSATGYDLTNLTVYGGWVNNGRDQQAYTVYYSTTAAPTTFFYLAQVNYNPAVAANLLDATRVTLTSSVGVLASNVAAVKFDFTNPGSENGYCGYAGITVFGSASIPPAVPASLSATVQAAQTGFIINAGSLVVGRNYTLQSTTNLAAATWTAENNFVATQTTTAWTNSNSNNPQKFYRLAGY